MAEGFTCAVENENYRSACKDLPRYSGSRYCVLHEPDEAKNKEGFEEAKKSKLARKDYDFGGTIFPEGTSDFVLYKFDADANFNGATFVGKADFTGAQFSGENTTFSEARFSGERTSFKEAQFSGKKVSFFGAQFGSEVTSFVSAQFSSGGWTSFASAQFSGEATGFSFAQFSGEVTSFASAQFNSSEWTSFIEAQFSGEETAFNGAQFSGQRTVFSEAEFSSWTSFNEVQFNSSEGTSFIEAQFSGLETLFNGAQFSGEETAFNGAQFSGNSTYFDRAQFSGGHTDFDRAQFSGKQTSFFGAQFSGEETYFSGARFDSTETIFLEATFTRKVYFSGASFSEKITFGGTKESPLFGSQAWVTFHDSRIETPELLTFNTVLLHPGWFINTDVRKVNFTNVEWYGMPGGPKGTLDGEIDSLKKQHVESPHTLLAQACRRLSANAEENREYPQANEFHYWSMDALRIGRWRYLKWLRQFIEKNWRRVSARFGLIATLLWIWRTLRREPLRHTMPTRFGLVPTFYWALSGYGVRAARAFWILVAIWATFTTLYVLVDPSEFSDFGQGIGYRWQAAVYSLLALARLNPQPRPDEPGLFQFLVGLEGILGPLQIALLALAIRRQVMR